MQVRQQEKMAALMLLDTVAMASTFACAMLLGYKAQVNVQAFLNYEWGFATVLLSTLLIFFILDLYSLRKLPEIFLHQVPIIAFGLVLSSILVTFIFFFIRNPVPRAVFILFYFFAFLAIVAVRIVFNRITMKSVYWKILIVGDKHPSEKITRLINDRFYLRSRVVGFVSREACGLQPETIPCLGSLDELPSLIDQHGVSQVIVTTPGADPELHKALLLSMRKKVRISDFRSIMEEVTGKVPIHYLDDNWFILSLSAADKRYFWYGKRIFDVFIGIAGICFTFPVLLFSALLIKLDSRGPILYSQQRMGRGNKPFRVWKLRTMVDGADKNNVYWTEDNDKRITRVGRLIRKMRLDEVPQLFNILNGDMTLIGPRPEAISLSEMYAKEIPYYLERHMVTPGITGWAQINYRYGNSIEDTKEKLKYDFYYIKHRGFVLDMIIFLRTIRIVLTGKGAM